MTSKKGKKNIDHSYDEAVQYNKIGKKIEEVII